MDEDTKRRFDAIAELWKGCWQRITERRSYEWKITLTLWTALALLIGVLLTGQLEASTRALPIGVGIVGFLVVLAHGVYLSGVGTRHADDREMAFHYEQILRTLSNSEFSEQLKESLAKITKYPRTLFREWSRRVQVSVSCILYIAAVLVSILQTLNDPP